jgi:hypothetical protein
MSGATGAERIRSRDDYVRFLESYSNIISAFDGFRSLQSSGSYCSDLSKQSFGDIDIVVHIESELSKKDLKLQLIKYLEGLPSDTIVEFASEKYKGKRSYNSGEIVTVRYHDADLGYSVQIDNIIALSENEAEFKVSFLNMPAAKQGLILGLVKTALLENDAKEIFDILNIQIEPLNDNQEYEFNLSSSELQLRKVTYIPNTFTQSDREVIWRSVDFDDVLSVLPQYNLNQGFETLLNVAKYTIQHPRSFNRVRGVFSSMISVKSGEKNTPKGNEKLHSLMLVEEAFLL